VTFPAFSKFFHERKKKKIHIVHKNYDIRSKQELNDLYSSPNIVRVIKSRRMRWAGHVTRMGEGRGAYRIYLFIYRAP
jgi:hypothetical protein